MQFYLTEDLKMIIAEIGHTKFLLDSMESAEGLLRIIAKATQVSESYVGPRAERITYKDPNATSIEIKITGNTQVMEYEDAMKLKQAEKLEAA
jgi:hypothetical protein